MQVVAFCYGVLVLQLGKRHQRPRRSRTRRARSGFTRPPFSPVACSSHHRFPNSFPI